jgi:SPP1 family predicted phage head-tail adaptor
VRAGKLRNRVTIQKRIETTDSEGRTSETWIPLGSAWVAIEPTTATEPGVAEQPEAQIIHRVTVRFRKDLDHNSRLLYGDRVLDVQSAPNVLESNREIDLLCIERKQPPTT